jgi:hypothetical protein
VKIRFYAKEVYGNTNFYPIDYVDELKILTNQKTLTGRTIKALETMGFTFEEVLNPCRRKQNV